MWGLIAGELLLGLIAALIAAAFHWLKSQQFLSPTAGMVFLFHVLLVVYLQADGDRHPGENAYLNVTIFALIWIPLILPSVWFYGRTANEGLKSALAMVVGYGATMLLWGLFESFITRG